MQYGMNDLNKADRQRQGLPKKVEDAMKKETAIEKAFRKANLIGESVDLWAVIYSYKVLRNLPEKEIEEIYDDLAERLGFTW